MLHILLTVHPSTRLPGKNAALWPYTRAWLAQELLYLPEPARVWAVGTPSELGEPLPPAWRVIPCAAGSHMGDLQQAERAIAPAADDVCVLPQITQPLRRRHLLSDMAEAARECGSAVSCIRTRCEPWRMLADSGAWGSHAAADAAARPALLDGACYAWLPGRVADIFDPAAPHARVINYDGPLVDVDEAADVPSWLASAFADLLLPAGGRGKKKRPAGVAHRRAVVS